nr:GGDEF domain-containing protein [Clostridia bacterium]
MSRKRIAALMAGVDQEYQQGFTWGMYNASQEKDVDLCIFNCQGHADGFERNDKGERAIFSLPNLKDFDGVVLLQDTIPTKACSEMIFRMLREYPDMPLVTVDGQWGQSVSITFDDNSSVRELMTHLIERHGFRDFALVTGPVGTSVADNRAQAARSVIEEYGVNLPKDAIFDGRWVREGGRRAADKLLARDKPLPQVIVCGNDGMAFGVVERLREKGVRIPEEVAVTGFDACNEAVGRGLTTIHRPVQEAGEKAVNVLVKWMEQGKPEHPRYIMPTRIIYGDSCRCELDGLQATTFVRLLSAERRDVEQTLLKGAAFFSGVSGMLDVKSAGERLASFARNWKAKQFHVCVDPNFLQEKPAQRSSVYPEEMQLLCGWSKSKSLPQQLFETRKLLPVLTQEREKPMTLVFSPLYSAKRNFGYVVFDMEHAAGYGLYALLTLLSASLNSMSLHATVQSYAAALEDMSTHDVLTGLLNRRGMARVVMPVFDRAVEEQNCFAVISLDANNMKYINDTFGHPMGDEAICRLSRVLKYLEQFGMTCVHISGDEFLAAGVVEDEAEAEHLRMRLEKELERFNREDPWCCDIEAGMGVYAAVPQASEEIGDFMRLADHQMYIDKEAKKRRHQ